MDKKEYSENTINTVQKLVPMDDVLFQKICESKETCQEIISAILGEKVEIHIIHRNSRISLKESSYLSIQRRGRLRCVKRLNNWSVSN